MNARWKRPQPAPRQRSHGVQREMGAMTRALRPQRRAALLWLGVVSRGPTSSMVGGMIAKRSASID
jgi:hypothetical protein